MIINIDPTGCPYTKDELVEDFHSIGGSKHYCLSEGCHEQMAHGATSVLHKGIIYTCYMGDDVNARETETATSMVRLSIKSLLHLEAKPEIIDVAKAYQDMGSFVQSSRAPYDQNMIFADDMLYMFWCAKPTDTNRETVVYRRFNVKTKQLEDNAVICTLDGNTFDSTAIISAYCSRTGQEVGGYQLTNCNSALMKLSDGKYYLAIGAICQNFNGILVSSSNLKDWETVTAVRIPNTTCSLEYAIGETKTGELTVAIRCENNGIHMGHYSLVSNSWTTAPTLVPSTIAARPHIFKYMNKWYLICNVAGSITTEGYGTVVRATAKIFRISDNETLNEVKTMRSKTGICYFKTMIDTDGRLLMSYSTDERMLHNVQVASNIALDTVRL